jgi:hypothetical protein
LRRFPKMLAVCALALPIPAAIAGCGGDDSTGSGLSAQEVLDQTFNNDQRVSSGDLSLSISGGVDGSQSGSFDASLEGPFQGDPDNPNTIPQLDWTGSLSFDGAGQSGSFDGGLTVTTDNAYVEYGGNTYEVGTDTFSQFKQLAESAAAQQQQSGSGGLSVQEAFKQACATQLQTAGATDTSACDIDLSSWLSEPQSEGSEDIDGTPSDHISGSVNIDTVLSDITDLAAATGQTVPAQAEDQINQVADATDITYDLYSGSDDHILRGLDFDFSIDTGSIPAASASGVDGVNASFSLRLAGVNEDQTIEAPSNAKPLAELLQQFGIDPSALGGLGSLGSGLGGSGTGGTSGGGGNAEAYFQCIQQAQTSAEIEKCSSQL